MLPTMCKAAVSTTRPFDCFIATSATWRKYQLLTYSKTQRTVQSEKSRNQETHF